ncbi:fatty acid-binding protein, intestinal-like [Brachyhypopomus gauderio]|uniref:fatty acid-binding protein, intestinal-like n=1 Tax=Brachyhypopomus gauderio TaxID=698409 RepID=UPI0040427864
MAFDGTWKVDRNENYDKFMEQMGINLMKRKLAEHDNLKLVIQQDGTKFTIKESSRFRTKDIEFTLGVQFEYSLADGTELSGTWEMDGDSVMIGKFTRKDNGKALNTTRTLEGGEMVQAYNYDGVDAKRIFKKA